MIKVLQKSLWMSHFPYKVRAEASIPKALSVLSSYFRGNPWQHYISSYIILSYFLNDLRVDRTYMQDTVCLKSPVSNFSLLISMLTRGNLFLYQHSQHKCQSGCCCFFFRTVSFLILYSAVLHVLPRIYSRSQIKLDVCLSDQFK